MKHRVRGSITGCKIKAPGDLDFTADKRDISDYSKQQLPDAANHFPFDERVRRCIRNGKFDSALLLNNPNIKICVLVQHLPSIVSSATYIQNGECAAPQYLMLISLAV